MPVLPPFPLFQSPLDQSGQFEIAVGTDLVQISRIRASVEKFGAKFMHRIFTEAELEYAQSSVPFMLDRLAARFAAKEAALKALSLADQGVGWRELEVVRRHDGHCLLQLHGRAAAIALEKRVQQTALSLSHDGDYASAIVVAVVHSSAS